MILSKLLLGAGCACLLMAGGAVSARAENAAPADDKSVVRVELNNARQTKQGCRLSFIFRNGLTTPIASMALEVVLFDKAGLVNKFIKLKTGSLPPAKLRVKQFDLKGLDCTDLSRILINDITECAGDGLAPASCLSALRISNRTGIKLAI